jgi:hypothetical protein
MRRASDAPWKVWGNRLVYRMSRTEKISGRRDDWGVGPGAPFVRGSFAAARYCY